MKKRLTALFLALALVFALLPAAVLTASAEICSGTCGGEGDGSNLTWTLDTETGVLEIAGTGKMKNWAYSSNIPWASYLDSVKSAIIGSGVTSIGSYAFSDCTALTSVTIPDSVTSIGSYAFNGCTGLTSVTIPGGVTSIGYSSFKGCTGLTRVTIGNSLMSIDNYAFENCIGLTSLMIPDSVTSIGYWAFEGCTGLTSITVDTGNAVFCSMGGVLYNKEKTALIRYPAGKADAAFVIPDSVTYIGSGAFNGCTGLTSVTIPGGVTYIGGSAFYGTGYYNDNANWTGDVLYIGKYLVSAKSSLSGTCAIKEGTTLIADDAFFGLPELTSVTIPDSVTCIGQNAFYNCTALTSITIGSGVTRIGGNAFYRTGYYMDASNWTDGVFYIGSYLIKANWKNTAGACTVKEGTTLIADDAFLVCSGLTSITLPSSLTSIGYRAFAECSGLTSVTIPNSVTSIDEAAFADCTGLTSVTIPYSVTSIGADAFGFYWDDETNETAKVDGFTIYGYTKSAAQTYAKENGLTFIALGDAPVGPVVTGDMNGDGDVDAVDSIRLARYLVGLVELTDAQIAAADVNGDGDVTATDAIRLARYLVGLVETLKPEPAKAVAR